MSKSDPGSGGQAAPDVFSACHPVVNMLYFSLVMAFAMFLMHPVCLAVSLAGALAYAIRLNGRKIMKTIFIFALPMLILTALINPAFNHEGATILRYLPSGNPLTLESVLYGAAAAAMLVAVVLWFACFNAVMTSDKFVYLFGRVIPALSLVLSMALRFVPRFRAQIMVVSAARRCVGRDVSNGSLLQRARHGVRILSVMVTWALENAIETADSMKARGYGLPGRTAFSIFRFDRRDFCLLAFILVCGAYIIGGAAAGGLYWRWFPTVRVLWGGALPVSLFAAHCALCALPVIFNLAEDRKWKTLRMPTESKT
ncbi:MAG: energy-coupling factor transporter transmembrane protein EcfT [Gracilibacteraceae bacterium]|jgi:energy-coupling factor transport system permease protein|nr:energy-coupling factor transporter transmembrane protein EcfT [Gracilibacteraceae bacterium]